MTTTHTTDAAGGKPAPPRTYTGSGKPPSVRYPGAWDKEEPYRPAPELIAAVDTALYLRRPLLIEGEPGTGKTRLAYAVAYELGLPLHEIYIRSTTRAQDLLWTFDAVQRLYDIQAARGHHAWWRPWGGAPPGPAELRKYVRIEKLGRAIELSTQNVPSVVLIDEIDKADIDFPNDLLQVLDRLEFEVTEVPGWRVDALGGRTREQRREFLPLIIITSNRERELPAPFLRRCLFAHIPFPRPAELRQILIAHAGRDLTPLFEAALARFWELRELKRIPWRKPPSTSEFLDWVGVLEREEAAGRVAAQGLREAPVAELPHLESLLKTQVDRETLAAGTAAPVADDE